MKYPQNFCTNLFYQFLTQILDETQKHFLNLNKNSLNKTFTPDVKKNLNKIKFKSLSLSMRFSIYKDENPENGSEVQVFNQEGNFSTLLSKKQLEYRSFFIGNFLSSIDDILKLCKIPEIKGKFKSGNTKVYKLRDVTFYLRFYKEKKESKKIIKNKTEHPYRVGTFGSMFYIE